MSTITVKVRKWKKSFFQGEEEESSHEIHNDLKVTQKVSFDNLGHFGLMLK